MVKVGTVLEDKYEILKKIGQGGMSIVYVAMDIRLNKQWAIKEIKNDGKKNKDTLLKGLEIEANILKKVDHPALPRIVDIIDDNGSIYVVMDYIEGRTLSEVLKTEGAQPQEKVVEWAKELSSALDYLHSLNPPIIYRDMKPSNIMLKPEGTIKLIDFGTAKEFIVEDIADTTALGTRGYAAPEQFGDSKGRGIYKTDARTDIYSLGATLYHVVTGRNPSEPPYVIKPIREWNPSLSSGLEKILSKCTMANPDDRYQSCSELIYALEHYEELDDQYRRDSFKKLRKFLIPVGLSVMSLIVSIIGYIGIQRTKEADYDNLLNAAYTATVRGDYDEASSIYTEAIRDVDGTRSEAYIDLINLYVNYIDDPDSGLNQVTYYIDKGYSGIDTNEEVLREVAITYFDVERDYKTSAYYFQKLDDEEATYYSSISLALSELNTDYEKLTSDMEEFETITDELTLSTAKLMNYKLLCIAYTRNLKNFDDAADGAIRCADKGLALLEDYEDDSIKAEYYVVYNQYLSLAYEELATRAEDSKSQEEYYNRAMESARVILDMVSKEEDSLIGIATDASLREAKMCQIADIYEKLGDYDKAIEEYEAGEKEFASDSKVLYIGHLTLLCTMEDSKDSDVENWDYTTLSKIYDEGSKVEGIEDDYRWKQLTQKLAPLFEKNGR